jgi:DNA modification methylase
LYVGQTIKPVKELPKTPKSSGKYVDLHITSARYGIIGENDLIVPYEAKLDVSSKEKLKKWSEKRKVVSKLQDIVAKEGYD